MNPEHTEIDLLLLNGINERRSDKSEPLEAWLQSLQTEVKMLRNAYRRRPVQVDYYLERVQCAYLLTYFPHYYQLIEKVLKERYPQTLTEKAEITLTFIGGGPAPEAYGAIKFILEHNENIKRIRVNILDINADSWSFSHGIVHNYLIRALPGADKLDLHWAAKRFDFTSPEAISGQDTISQSDLVVMQNCLNEIEPDQLQIAKHSILEIFKAIPYRGILLMIDLTSSVRSQIGDIQEQLQSMYSNADIFGTLSQCHCSSMRSLHPRPSEIIKENLLIGASGLIAKANLKYDYSFVSKGIIRRERDITQAGLSALYRPFETESFRQSEEINQRVFVGLDIGSSTAACAIAYVKDNQLQLECIEFEQKGPRGQNHKDPLCPTVLGVLDGSLRFGRFAHDHIADLNYGKNVWHRFKNHLGSLHDQVYNDSVLLNHPKFAINNAKDAFVLFLKDIGRQLHKFLELKGLTRDIYLSASIPADFSEYKAHELRECLQDAGLNISSSPFCFEPISAIVNSIYSKHLALIPNELPKNITVLDFGAYTVDISILRIEMQGEEVDAQVLASEKNEDLGSASIDEKMLEAMTIETGQIQEYKNRLTGCGKKLKEKMCKSITLHEEYTLPDMASDESQRLEIPCLENPPQKIGLSYGKLHSIMEHYWLSLQESMSNTIRRAELSDEKVDYLVLSGGGARNPYVRAFAKDYFKEAQMIIPDNIQEQVAKGNALQCFSEFGFGKRLLNSKLSHDLLFLTEESHRVLFYAGSFAPTLEQELGADSVVKGYIELSFRESDYIIRYEVPEGFERAFVYLEADLEVQCEMIIDGEIHNPQKLYKKLDV